MKRVLVLGGTKFMGRELLALLQEEYAVVAVHRGRSYWDTCNSGDRIFSKVNRQLGDRDAYQDFRQLLIYLSRKFEVTEAQPWHAVVDFCAFKPKHVRSVKEALAGLTRIYILVSSDSVYEVCDHRLRTSPLAEHCSVRPQSDRRARELA
jgi:hypothetical protein